MPKTPQLFIATLEKRQGKMTVIWKPEPAAFITPDKEIRVGDTLRFQTTVKNGRVRLEFERATPFPPSRGPNPHVYEQAKGKKFLDLKVEKSAIGGLFPFACAVVVDGNIGPEAVGLDQAGNQVPVFPQGRGTGN